MIREVINEIKVIIERILKLIFVLEKVVEKLTITGAKLVPKKRINV